MWRGGEGLLPPAVLNAPEPPAHRNHKLSRLLPMAAPAANLQQILSYRLWKRPGGGRRSCRAAPPRNGRPRTCPAALVNAQQSSTSPLSNGRAVPTAVLEQRV